MNDNITWITRNGVHIPITNKYMNDKIRGKKETFESIDADTPEEFTKERKEYVDKNIKFENVSKGNYNTLRAILDNKIAGDIRYEVNDGKSSIININVSGDYRRSGVATHLYKKLQSKTPNDDLIVSNFTDAGEKLANKIGKVKYKNGKYYVRIN